MASYPSQYRYTKQHEWINVEGDTGTIGITDHAQEALGDIVYVELPKVGTEVEAHKAFGSVESVKAVSDLYAPLSGTVTELNDELTASPEKINANANESWMIKIKLKNAGDADSLMTVEQYEAFMKEEQ